MLSCSRDHRLLSVIQILSHLLEVIMNCFLHQSIFCLGALNISFILLRVNIREAAGPDNILCTENM